MTAWRSPEGEQEQQHYRDQINALRYNFLLEQIPLLYAVMLVASAIGALAMQNAAPTPLVTVVPATLTLVTAARGWKWLQMRSVSLSPSQIDFQLTVTTYLAPFMAFCFTLWAAALFDYGDEFQKALITLLVMICLILTSVILSILPKAASLAVFASCLPFTMKFLLTGNTLLICMLFIFLSVAALVQQVLRRYSVSFGDLIESRNQLKAQFRETERSKRALVRQAYHDELSGLANRRRFLRKLNTLVRTDHAGERKLYVGVIDIDGFRAINDVHGYAVGDMVLKEVADRLYDVAKGKAIVARYDGDEFAFLLTNIHDVEEVQAFADRLCRELQAPYATAGHAAHLTASCGLSVYPDNGSDAETLVYRAYYALHHVKDDDNTRVSLFDQRHESELQECSRIEQALRRAMSNGGFTVAFQPIVDLKTGRTVTCEALARWHDAELGTVSPAKFIPIAEQSGLISELTFLLLEKAARQATQWPKNVLLSFNVSALEIIKPSAGLHIHSILNDAGLDPRRLEIEITETAFLKDFEAANATLKGLRGAGVRVALDDFGTGQSSLQYVEKIALDKLKIDRAFVSSVTSSSKTRHVIEAIADMCKRLDIKTVAEGIEDAEQARIMFEIGCDYGQGYLFAPAARPGKPVALFRPPRARKPAIGRLNAIGGEGSTAL